jgi:ATPase family associated with various cellular activities (AAA)
MVLSTDKGRAVTLPSPGFDVNNLKVNTLNTFKGMTNKLHFPSLKCDFSPRQVLSSIFSHSKLGRSIQEISSHLSVKGARFSEIQQAECIEAIKSNEFKSLKTNLSKIIGKLSSEKLNSLLTALFKSCSENPLPVINKLKSILTLQKIDAVVCGQFTGYSALEDAKRVSKFVAGEYQTISEEKKQTYLRTAIVYVKNLTSWVVENLTLAFALNDIGGEVDDSAQATMRVMMLFNLWGSINAWLLSLSAMLGSAALTATVISSGLFVGTASLIIYNKWLKPVPKCPPFEDITAEVAKGNGVSGTPQEDKIDAVIQALCANTGSTRRHPILVGSPGTGKTTVIDGVAERINSGNVPDQLKNATLLGANGTHLLPTETSKVSKGRTMDNLSKFQKKMKDLHVIPFIDEIHVLGMNGGENIDKLKTFFDPGPSGFRYCIGATTPKEYEMYLAGNFAFERRIEIIPIDETDEETTMLILKVMARQEAEDIEVDDDVFEAVYDLCKHYFPDMAQPAKAKTVLAKAFSRVRSRKNSSLGIDLRKLKNERSILSNDYMRCNESRTYIPMIKVLYEQLEAKNQQIVAKDKAIKEEMDKFSSFAKLKIQRNELKRDIQAMAIKIAKGQASEDFIKEFAFKQNFVKPALDSLIAVKQKEFSESSTKVDVKLITKIVLEEVAKIEKSKKKVDPELEQAYLKTKKLITAIAVKMANGTATSEEVMNLKIYRDHVIPSLQEAMNIKA